MCNGLLTVVSQPFLSVIMTDQLNGSELYLQHSRVENRSSILRIQVSIHFYQTLRHEENSHMGI